MSVNSDKSPTSFSKVNNDNDIKKAKDTLRTYINRYNNFFININLISNDVIKTLLPLLIMDDIEPLLQYIDTNINNALEKVHHYIYRNLRSEFFKRIAKLKEDVFNKNEKTNVRNKSIFIIKYLRILIHYFNPRLIAVGIDKYINQDCETYIEAFEMLNLQQIKKFCDEILVGKRESKSLSSAASALSFFSEKNSMEYALNNCLHDIRTKYYNLLKTIELIDNIDDIIRLLLDFLINYNKDILLFYLENINHKFLKSEYTVFYKYGSYYDDESNYQRKSFIQQFQSLKINTFEKQNIAVDLREKCIFTVKYLHLLSKYIKKHYILNYIYYRKFFDDVCRVSEKSINALKMLNHVQIKDLFNNIILEQQQHEQKRKERGQITMITEFLELIYSS